MIPYRGEPAFAPWPRPMTVAVSCAALVLALCSTAGAEERSLDAALEAYDRGELDQALADFEAVLASGTNAPDDLVTIHVHLGILRGVGGDLESARRSFQTALALNPMLAAPSELGGQLRSLFEDLRSARAGRRLVVELRPQGDTTFEVSASNAPPGTVSSIRVVARAQPGGPSLWERRMDGPGPTTVTVPAATWPQRVETLVLTVEAFDRSGNRLSLREAELARPATTATEGIGSTAEPGGDAGAAQATEYDTGSTQASTEGGQRRHRRWRWYQHPAFWTVIGVLVVGGVTAGLVVGLSENDRYVVGAPQVR